MVLSQLTNYPNCFIDQFTVTREDTFFQIEIVFQTDPHVATEQHRLCHHRHLGTANTESRPEHIGWQLSDHRVHGCWISTCTPGNSKTYLKHGRGINEPLAQHLAGKPHVTQIEYLHLRLNTNFLVTRGHTAEHVGGLHIDIVAVTEIDGATIERCNIRPQ